MLKAEHPCYSLSGSVLLPWEPLLWGSSGLLWVPSHRPFCTRSMQSGKSNSRAVHACSQLWGLSCRTLREHPISYHLRDTLPSTLGCMTVRTHILQPFQKGKEKISGSTGPASPFLRCWLLGTDLSDFLLGRDIPQDAACMGHG